MGINDFIKIGEKIKKARIDAGYKQKDFAIKLGIPVSTLANYEGGKREPNSDIIKKVADTLNLSLSDLFTPDLDTDETTRIKAETNAFIQKMVDTDVFGENKENFITEQRVLSDLYDKYFLKLLSWRFKNTSSIDECFTIMIHWLIGLKYERFSNLNDEDITELSVLFERLLEMKSHEHDFFNYSQEEYGTQNYSILSRTFLTTKQKKEGE